MRRFVRRVSPMVSTMLVGTLALTLVLTGAPWLVAQVALFNANEIRANTGSDLTLKAASGKDVRIGDVGGTYRAVIMQRGMRLQMEGGAGGCAGSLGPLPLGGSFFSVRTDCLQANSMIFLSFRDSGVTVSNVPYVIRTITSGASFSFATSAALSEAVTAVDYMIVNRSGEVIAPR